ncbi:RT30 protein, partial [Atractosteus spatula]|nr:RT30 protein [Atractosteus spatula]
MAASSRLSLQLFALKRGLILNFRRVLHTEPSVREPAYPPIIPSRTAKSKSAKKLREEEFINQVRSAATVQEKLRLLTKFQRKKYVLYPQTFALNADRWYQHFTKTAYLPGLPKTFSVESGSKLKEADVIDSDVFSELRSLVCNAILQENFYLKKRRPFLQREQEHFVAPFLSNMVSAVTNTLAKHNPLLKVSSLDFGPQVNFYWMRGETTVPRGHRRGRVDPVRFQIDDQPHSQLRVPQQLPEVLGCFFCSRFVLCTNAWYWDLNYEKIGLAKQYRCLSLDFQTAELKMAKSLLSAIYTFKSRDHWFKSWMYYLTVTTLAKEVVYSFLVNVLSQGLLCATEKLTKYFVMHTFLHIPGSKVADPCCYGHTQFHLVGDRLRRDKLAKANLADQVEVGLRANAIASLFAWTGAQAMYQGFWSHEDVTRPFVSQAVITDGLHFSFFCYQLNTLGLTVQTDSNNPRKNVCWGTESMRLYEGVKDGDVIGWNDSVLKLLVQFLMNRPHTM